MPVRNTLIILLVSVVLGACAKGAAPAASASAPLLIAPEDVHTIHNSALTSGPAITGSIQPERRADLRAEVPAIVLQVYKENGDPVHKGDVLVRSTTPRSATRSPPPEAAQRASGQASTRRSASSSA